MDVGETQKKQKTYRAVAVCDESRMHGGNGGDGETGRKALRPVPTHYLADVHTLALTHRGPLPGRCAALVARRAEIYQIQSASFRTSEKEIVTRFGTVAVSGGPQVRSHDRIAPEFHPGKRRRTPGGVGTEDMPTRHGDTAIAPGTGRLRPSTA